LREEEEVHSMNGRGEVEGEGELIWIVVAAVVEFCVMVVGFSMRHSETMSRTTTTRLL